MSVDVQTIRARITNILRETPADRLATITGKDVRTQLAQYTDIDKQWLKDNKKAIKDLIRGVFEAESAHLVPAGAIPPSSQPDGTVDDVKQDQDEDEGEFAYPQSNGVYENGVDSRYASGSQLADEEDDFVVDEKPSKPKKKAKSSREVSDEQFARQLEMELNGRVRSARSGKQVPKTKKGTGRTSKAKKKSAEQVDDSDGEDDGDGGGGGTKKKKRGGGGAKGGFGKEFVLSAPLSALLQADRMSRPQVVKQLWVYIKDNNLQNPSNKREILCDDALRPVFNADKIDMFKMNKVLGSHLHEAEDL